jgi:hypothetical protein
MSQKSKSKQKKSTKRKHESFDEFINTIPPKCMY